jgi:hypothetical protein
MKKWKLRYKLPSGTEVTYVSSDRNKVFDEANRVIMAGLRGVISPK